MWLLATAWAAGGAGSTLGLCVPVLGTHGRVLVAEGCRGGICGSCQELPSCLTEPMPASSRRDPPQARAESISGGGTSGIADMGVKISVQLQ